MDSLVSISTECQYLDKIFRRKGSSIDWRLNANGIVTELGEFLNELPFRPWRISDVQKFNAHEPPSDKAYDEFADLLITTIRVALQAGLSIFEIENAIDRHFERKYNRIHEGIDG